MAETELSALRRKAAEQAVRLEALERFHTWRGRELPLQGLYRFPQPGAPLTDTQLQELIATMQRQLSEATNHANALRTELDTEVLLCEDQQREIFALERAVHTQAAKVGFKGSIHEYLTQERGENKAFELLRTALEHTAVQERELTIAITQLTAKRVSSPENEHYLCTNRENIKKSVRTREDLAEEMTELRRYLERTKRRSGDIIALERANAALLAEYGKLQDFRFHLESENRVLTQEIAAKRLNPANFSQIRTENTELKSTISTTLAEIESQSRQTNVLECANSAVIEKLGHLRITCQKLSAQRSDLEVAVESVCDRIRSVEQELLQTRGIEEKLEQKVWEKEMESDKLIQQNCSQAAEYAHISQEIDSINEAIAAICNEQEAAATESIAAFESVKSELEALSRSKLSLASDLHASALSKNSLQAELSTLQTVSQALPSVLHSQTQLQVSLQDTLHQISIAKEEVAQLQETTSLLLSQLAGP